MGGGTFDPGAYANYSAKTASLRRDEIYTSRHIHKYLDPLGVKLRESRDSPDNPNSTPIICGIDVTGSMGGIAEVLARKGLGTLFNGILDRKPVTDPHVMFMAIGDANCDKAPLQVSQFEADNRIVEQLTSIFLEGGGGGNGFESYNLPWYFAAFHTEHDALIKRGRRGYLFTVGDEDAPGDLTQQQIKRVIGDDLAQHLSTKEMLELAQRKYDVFHVVILEGDHCRRHLPQVRSSWDDLLGQRVIYLEDHLKLAETIVSAIEVAEGRDAHGSAHAWGGDTARVVHEAVKHLPKGVQPKLLGHL